MADDGSTLNFDELRTFVAVAEERHFARAGQRLHLSQPAVSRQISRLESTLGSRLLNRSKRRVSLTVAGEAVFRDAEAVLAAAARLMQHVGDVSSGAVGRVRIAATPTPAFCLLASVIRDFRRLHPQFELDWRTGTAAEITGLVLRNDVDLAVVSGPLSHGELRGRVIGTEPLWVVTAPGIAAPSDYRQWSHEVPWIVRTPGTPARETWDAWCKSQRMKPTIGLVVSGAYENREAVLAGVGAALLPAALVREDVRAKRLQRARSAPKASQDFVLVDHPHKHHGAACRAMIALL
jgi:LysR family transcriptional regulator, transcriptional activator of the cysJI operon